jgi:hypothetical protein
MSREQPRTFYLTFLSLSHNVCLIHNFIDENCSARTCRSSVLWKMENMISRFYSGQESECREPLIPRGIQAPEVLAPCVRYRVICFLGQNFHARCLRRPSTSIGADQTISQPYMFALMTRIYCMCILIQNVLEIGLPRVWLSTAILAELAREVYTIERITTLATCCSNTNWALTL